MKDTYTAQEILDMLQHPAFEESYEHTLSDVNIESDIRVRAIERLMEEL